MASKAVRTAESLAGAAKAEGYQIVVSRDAARQAGWAAPEETALRVEAPGEAELVSAVGIAQGRDIPAAILAEPGAPLAPVAAGSEA